MAYDVSEMESYIRQAAVQRGIDPEIAVRVAKSEGLGRGVWQSQVRKNGVQEPSYGPFQLLVGGDGTNFPGGMGNDFIQRTGLDPSNPDNAHATVDFALDRAAQGGWSPWYGARAIGVTGMEGIGNRPTQMADSGQVASDATNSKAPTTGTDPYDPWLTVPSLGLSVGPFVGADPQAQQAAETRRNDLLSGRAEVPPMAPSPDYSTGRNLMMSLGHRMTSSDAPWYANPNALTSRLAEGLDYAVSGIMDFGGTPENQLPEERSVNPSINGTGKERDALVAALTGRPTAGADPTAPGTPSQANAFATGIPVTMPPARPEVQPYVIPEAPQLRAPEDAPQITGPNYDQLLADRAKLAPTERGAFNIPAPPEMRGPDMTKARELFAQAAPKPYDDSQYTSANNWNNIAAALANAAGGAPGQEFANFGMTLSHGNSRIWGERSQREQRDAETARRYALQGADFESGIASSESNIFNQNAQSKYKVDAQNAENIFESAADAREKRRQFDIGTLDFKKDVLEQNTDLANKNAQINYRNRDTQRQFRNDQTATNYERTQKNAATAYAAAQENAKNLYLDQSTRYELTAPKVLRSDKDGLVVQKVRNNAQGEPEYVYEVKKWTEGSNALGKETLDQLDALKTTFGENTPSYQIAKYSALLNARDVGGLKFEIARDAANGGYLDGVLEQNFGEQADDKLSEMGVQPGLDKDYAEKRSTLIGNLAASQMDLTNPELLRKLATAGNQGAAILLSKLPAGAAGGQQ